jgi:hypothetical protein
MKIVRGLLISGRHRGMAPSMELLARRHSIVCAYKAVHASRGKLTRVDFVSAGSSALAFCLIEIADIIHQWTRAASADC